MSAAAKPEATIGVGDGPGQLFVHGSHEAVKRVQAVILEAEQLRAEVARLSPTEDEIRYTADQDWTGLDGMTAYWLIDRHGDGWAGIGEMMEAWRDAEVQRITAGLTAERDAALAELARVQARGWPSTPEDVRALLGSRCGAVRYALPVPDGEFEAPPHESDTYMISAHDMITSNISASEMRYAADVGLERVRAELDRAREVLRELEWCELPHAVHGVAMRCPHCGGLQSDGHDTDCSLNAALVAKGE